MGPSRYLPRTARAFAISRVESGGLCRRIAVEGLDPAVLVCERRRSKAHSSASPVGGMVPRGQLKRPPVGSLQRQLDDDCVSTVKNRCSSRCMSGKAAAKISTVRPELGCAPVRHSDRSSVKVPSSVKHFTHPGTSWFSAIWYALRTIASLAASLAPNADRSFLILVGGRSNIRNAIAVHLYPDERQEHFCLSQW